MSQAVNGEVAGIDFGAGALKVYGRWGGIELPAHVAFAGRRGPA